MRYEYGLSGNTATDPVQVGSFTTGAQMVGVMEMLFIILMVLSPIFLWAGVHAGRLTRRRSEHRRDK